jgi:hypothetical protein
MFPFDLPGHVDTPFGSREPLVDIIAQVALSPYQTSMSVLGQTEKNSV